MAKARRRRKSEEKVKAPRAKPLFALILRLDLPRGPV
jgi:hypothetical protein